MQTVFPEVSDGPHHPVSTGLFPSVYDEDQGKGRLLPSLSSLPLLKTVTLSQVLGRLCVLSLLPLTLARSAATLV